MKRFLWLGFALSVYLICSGCGETYRPIIYPNPPVFPNPQASHTVLSINDNGDVARGSAMAIDVSGDSISSVVDLDIHPIHAVQQTASQVLVVNQGVTHNEVPSLPVPTTSCLVSIPPTPPNQIFNVCSSLTKLNFNGTVIVASAVISLPIYSGANFVAVAPSDTSAYVTMPTYPPDPMHPSTIVPSVGVVNTLSNALVQTIPVGNNPIALAVTPDKSKLYVANQGDRTISGFNTVDRSQRTGSPIATTLPPVWLVARTDSQRVYVLESDGTTSFLASIDTTSTAGPDPLTPSPGISVPGATSMTYDINLNRLYIAGGQTVAIVDVSQPDPVLIKTLSIPVVPSIPPVTASAVAVTALPDGTRAYVASVPDVTQPSVVNISAVQGNGTTATFTYTLVGGHNPAPGITFVVSGIASPNDGFNGTYTIQSVAGSSCATQTCAFQVASGTVLPNPTPVTGFGTSPIDNLFPQVTVIDVKSYTITKTLDMAGFPDATDPGNPLYYAPVCAMTRFRYTMASGGSSNRAYLAACDGGNVSMINTTNDTYVLNQPAPIGARAPIPPSTQNPPQNPVFLLAGP